MSTKRKAFRRPLGERPYRKLFVIAVEGSKTEPQYFARFNQQSSVIQIRCLKKNHRSDPRNVLKRMKAHLGNESLRKSDEAWLVIDKDQWTDDHLTLLYQWSQKAANYGLAVSHPKFEYWLLLHFKEGTEIGSSRECSDRLSQYLPNYDKNIDHRKITMEHITKAIARAKLRDQPPCIDWPRTIAISTVYRLVEKLLTP